MDTRIKVWQVNDNKLTALSNTLASSGRTEPGHLQKWLESEPTILGEDIFIIGSQVQTHSGPLDLLGIDLQGNTVIIELKRDKIPREAVAQAIDYASDVASWDIDKFNAVCIKYRQMELEEYLSEVLPSDFSFENIQINQIQRILLVGTEISEALERMINWLAEQYQIPINALLLTYIQTSSGDELLAKTTVITEEIEKVNIRQKTSFQSYSEPGEYDNDKLRELLIEYLTNNQDTSNRIRNVILPLCLQKDTVTREDIKNKLIEDDSTLDPGKTGVCVAGLSRVFGLKQNDFLRQIIRWKNPPNKWWEKENYYIPIEYKELVREILNQINTD